MLPVILLWLQLAVPLVPPVPLSEIDQLRVKFSISQIDRAQAQLDLSRSESTVLLLNLYRLYNLKPEEYHLDTSNMTFIRN